MIGPITLATDVIEGIKSIVSMGDGVRLNKCASRSPRCLTSCSSNSYHGRRLIVTPRLAGSSFNRSSSSSAGLPTCCSGFRCASTHRPCPHARFLIFPAFRSAPSSQNDPAVASGVSTASVLQCLLEALPRAQKARETSRKPTPDAPGCAGSGDRPVTTARLLPWCQRRLQVVEDHTHESGVVIVDGILGLLGSQDRRALQPLGQFTRRQQRARGRSGLPATFHPSLPPHFIRLRSRRARFEMTLVWDELRDLSSALSLALSMDDVSTRALGLDSDLHFCEVEGTLSVRMRALRRCFHAGSNPLGMSPAQSFASLRLGQTADTDAAGPAAAAAAAVNDLIGPCGRLSRQLSCPPDSARLPLQLRVGSAPIATCSPAALRADPRRPPALSVLPEQALPGAFFRLGSPASSRAQPQSPESPEASCSPLSEAAAAELERAAAAEAEGLVLSACADGSVRVWQLDGSLPTGCLHELSAHRGWAGAVSDTGAGCFATAGEDGWVREWAADSGGLLGGCCAGEPAFALASLPGGRVASGHLSGDVRVWGPRPRPLRLPPAFAGGPPSEALQNHHKAEPPWPLRDGAPPGAVDGFAHAAAGAAPRDTNPSATVWRPLQAILRGHDGRIGAVVAVASFCRERPPASDGGGGGGGPLERSWLELGLVGACNDCGAVDGGGARFPPLLATGSADGTVLIWADPTDSPGGPPPADPEHPGRDWVSVGPLVGHSGHARGLADLGRGYLLSGSWDGSLRGWDLASGACAWVVHGAHACAGVNAVCALAPLPACCRGCCVDGAGCAQSSEDAVLVASAGDNGDVAVWRWQPPAGAGAEPVLTLRQAHAGSAWALASAGGGEAGSGGGAADASLFLLSGGGAADGAVRLWDLGAERSGAPSSPFAVLQGRLGNTVLAVAVVRQGFTAHESCPIVVIALLSVRFARQNMRATSADQSIDCFCAPAAIADAGIITNIHFDTCRGTIDTYHYFCSPLQPQLPATAATAASSRARHRSSVAGRVDSNKKRTAISRRRDQLPLDLGTQRREPVLTRTARVRAGAAVVVVGGFLLAGE